MKEVILKRKIDKFLLNWKEKPNHFPLIVYGARQVGKTTSILNFGRTYKSIVYINFIENPEYLDCFDNFNIDHIIKRLSLINPTFKFINNETLIFFDEIQVDMNITTSLKFFSLDGRFDVICSGSSLGVNNSSVSSVSVGFKEEYIMHSLDFEEFLYAKGYDENFIEDLFKHMMNMEPFDNLTLKILNDLFNEYIFVGGFPRVVKTFIENNNFSGLLELQKNIKKDYKDDFSKYLNGLDIARAQKVYDSVLAQLSKENHKFQFTKLGNGARLKDYFGISEWIKNAGITLMISNVSSVSTPLAAYELPENFRTYFADFSLLIASLNDLSQKEIRTSLNFNIFNGAIYENVVADALNKQGIKFYFYRSEDSTAELDFIIECGDKVLPIEVKAKKGRQKSLSNVIDNHDSIKFGVKFGEYNIGKTDKIITFPTFLVFLLRRFALEFSIFDSTSLL